MKVLSMIATYFRLPGEIRKNVRSHFFKKITGSKSNDHEIIWTSFFYFCRENNVTVKQYAEGFRVTFEEAGKTVETWIRSGQSTDVFVFFQVFIARGYDLLLNFAKKNSLHLEVIIDAGANVGYFSQLTMLHFAPRVLVSIEPEKNNFQQLTKNLSLIPTSARLQSLSAAIWTENKQLLVDFETGNDWGFKVSETSGKQTCQAYPLEEIIAMTNSKAIDILKIDVEGTEDVLFRDQKFIQNLVHVKIIALEIHDHLTERKMIHDILHTSQFRFLEEGELTLAWNTRFINA